MDGENNGSKPYEQMDDLGGPPLFLETPKCGGVGKSKYAVVLVPETSRLEMVCALTLLLSRTSCWLAWKQHQKSSLISCCSSRAKASAFRQTIGQRLQKKRLHLPAKN